MRRLQGALLITAALVIVCITVCSGGRVNARGWLRCDCHWATWESWTDCNRDCYGYQYRPRKGSRRSYCDHFSDSCYSYSGSLLDSEWREWRNCNARCPYGYRRGSGRSKYCECPTGRYGVCCTHRISCGTPPSVSNGRYSYSGSYYGDTVDYSCYSDYRMVSGSSRRTCEVYWSRTGSWSGSTPRCLFVRTCRSNPCQHGSCEDLVERYKCHCYSGWAGHNCERDVQPPVVYGCPSSISRLTSHELLNVTWKKPTFTDPLGFEVRVSSNYDKEWFEFPWGDFSVHYYAYKPNNGLRAHCVFNVRVRPHPCPPLAAPDQGLVVCNGWKKTFGQFCLMSCLQDLYLPLGYEPQVWHVCGASGHWSSSLLATQCQDKHHTKPVSLLPQPKSCQDSAGLDDVRQQFVRELNASYFGQVFCEDMGSQCRPGNVRITCKDG